MAQSSRCLPRKRRCRRPHGGRRRGGAVILSASVNADIPARYAAWFRRRLEAGYLRVAGSDPWKQRRIDLTPARVDGIVFWTRDIASFGSVLDELRTRGIAFFVQYALACDRPLESPLASDEPARSRQAAIDAMHDLAQRYGPRAVVWRYDPLVLDARSGAEPHVDAFGAAARALRGAVDEAIVAFARPRAGPPQRKESATAADRLPPQAGPRRDLVRRLAAIASGCAMRLSVCADADALAPGASPARCVDARRLADIAGRAVDVPAAGFMRDCLCARAIDIGDHGGTEPLAFCGAGAARRPRLRHDPASEFLFEPVNRFGTPRAADSPF